MWSVRKLPQKPIQYLEFVNHTLHQNGACFGAIITALSLPTLFGGCLCHQCFHQCYTLCILASLLVSAQPMNELSFYTKQPQQGHTHSRACVYNLYRMLRHAITMFRSCSMAVFLHRIYAMFSDPNHFDCMDNARYELLLVGSQVNTHAHTIMLMHRHCR